MKLLTLVSVWVLGSARTERTEFCDSLVYCQGPILDLVQKSKIFRDSKSFVDMSQLNHPNETLRNFHNFMTLARYSPSQDQIRRFVEDNFVDETGLDGWIPGDYDSNPPILDKINDEAVKDFARDLVKLWPTLGRKVRSEVRDSPKKYSQLYLPNGFIAPGGRFGEMYYWDSYWIIKGLLLSGMKDTVRGILDNFIYLVKRYGFVPNGSRIYYLNRSQPPLLALMVGLYVDFTDNLEWLRQNIGVVERELRWWLTNRVVVVRKKGKRHVLAHYSSEADSPRPESYYEDVKTCAKFEQEIDKKKCYLNLRSGAESGWDFSSRWFFHPNGSKCTNLTHIQVRRIVPVDLNAYLGKAFSELSRFHQLVGNSRESFQWSKKFSAWTKSIESVFYDNQDGMWYDYDLTASQPRKSFYLSNLAPLWCETYNVKLRRQYGSKVVAHLKELEIHRFMFGVPTSLKRSGEQWDMPNAFPPLQEILILGLMQTGDADAREMATSLAHRWISTNIRSYNRNGLIFEKYNTEDPNEFATGGEYMVQIGFGWTNGVALSIINRFYTES